MNFFLKFFMKILVSLFFLLCFNKNLSLFLSSIFFNFSCSENSSLFFSKSSTILILEFSLKVSILLNFEFLFLIFIFSLSEFKLFSISLLFEYLQIKSLNAVNFNFLDKFSLIFFCKKKSLFEIFLFELIVLFTEIKLFFILFVNL